MNALLILQGFLYILSGMVLFAAIATGDEFRKPLYSGKRHPFYLFLSIGLLLGAAALATGAALINTCP